MSDDLEARLAAALETDDRPALVPLYQEAALIARTARQKAFFLTHAYVHALETGNPSAVGLRKELIALGAEEA